MNPTILYRRGVNPDEDDAEIQAAKDAGLRVIHHRTDVLEGELVIARYSCLPFYKELEVDVSNRGGLLVNSYREHRYIADMAQWVPDLEDLTPRLYRRLQDLPETGPFVLKGETNSKKHLWDTHMFAADKRAAGEVYSRLQDDMLLAQQEIYIRDYVPLKRLATGFNGLPITNEFRFFVMNGQVVTGAFYWSSHTADLPSIPSANQVSREFLAKVIQRIGDMARFYVIDVAETESGEWIVVELNDGQMSGLSCNTPEALYSGLRDC
jgi:hypothetical protein